MQQFNLMQQQLCEQFQQTTLMMFRMFTSMHQEQTNLIREEMQQIQRITGELQALQRKVGGDVGPVREGRSPREPQSRAAVPGVPARPAPASASFPSLEMPADGASASAKPTLSPIPPTPDSPQLPATSPAEVDAWLNQRIGELQAERQTRWQRVVGFLSGQ
jgi:hypothetical protein